MGLGFSSWNSWKGSGVKDEQSQMVVHCSLFHVQEVATTLTLPNYFS